MDLREVFHLALVEAAKRMQVCSTVLKKICRRDGINRWPYRKVFDFFFDLLLNDSDRAKLFPPLLNSTVFFLDILQLDSVKKKIAELRQNLNSGDAETRAEAQEKIDALRREAMNACGGINIL